MKEDDDFPDEDITDSLSLHDGPDNVGLKILPFYYFIMCFILASLLEIFFNRNLFRMEAQIILGALLCGVACVLGGWAYQTLEKAETSASPDEPTKVLVISGPYSFSRNPIYLSFFVAYLGLVILFDVVMGMVFILPLLWLFKQDVITPEETYLYRKFGKEYENYKNSVRRWL